MQRNREKLEDILAATTDILEFVEGLDFAGFQTNRSKRYAILYALTVVGEASSQVSPELRARHGEVPWRSIVDFRHRVVHGYGLLDLELVWRVAVEMAPILREQIEAVLAREYPNDR